MKNILLIEDNEDHAELIQNSLIRFDHDIKIEQVNLVSKATKKLKQHIYDIILSDYYLPDINDENYIQKLHQIAPTTPIVIISGKGDEETAAKSIQSGAEDYIVKTKEALLALPHILRRVWTKHQRNLKQINKEAKDKKQNQIKMTEYTLKEIEILYRMTKQSKKLDKNTIDSFETQLSKVQAQLKKLINQLKSAP